MNGFETFEPPVLVAFAGALCPSTACGFPCSSSATHTAPGHSARGAPGTGTGSGQGCTSHAETVCFCLHIALPPPPCWLWTGLPLPYQSPT